MANPFKIWKQITKKLSAANVIAVAKKGTEKQQNFFKSYFGHQSFFILIFILVLYEKRLNKNQ
jgi:hypothetical protein